MDRLISFLLLTFLPIISAPRIQKNVFQDSSLLSLKWENADTSFLFPWLDEGIREKIVPLDFKQNFEKIHFSRQKYREVLEFLIGRYDSIQGPGKNREIVFLIQCFEALGSQDSMSITTLKRLEIIYQTKQGGSERLGPIRLNIAKCFLAQGDTLAAQLILSELLETSPSTLAYLELVPSVIRNDGDIHKYLSCLSKLMELGKQQAKVWWLIGRELSNSLDETGAAAALIKCHELNPAFLLGRKGPIHVLHSAGKDTLAAFLADYYLKNIDSTNIEILTVKVEALDSSGAYPSLRRSAIKALVLRDPGLEFRLKQLVDLDLLVKDTSAALQNLNYWVQYHPRNKKVLEKLSLLYRKQSNASIVARKGYFEALSTLGQLGDSTEYKKWSLDKVAFLLETGFNLQAESLLSVLNFKFQRDPHIHYLLGKSRLGAGNFTGKKDIQMAWELEPHNLVYARDYVATLNDAKAIKQNLEVLKYLSFNNPTIIERYKLAFCLNQMGSHFEASKAWDPVLAEDPVNFVCDTFALDSYRKSGRLYVLKPWLELKLEKDLERASILSLLAEACDQAGQQDESLKWLELSASKFPFYGDIKLRLAKLKIVLGDFHAALGIYSQVLINDSAGFQISEKAKDISKISDDSMAIEYFLISQCDLFSKNVILRESLAAFFHPQIPSGYKLKTISWLDASN